MTSKGDQTHGRSALLPLTVTAIGVVYGDIGTSPLYTIRECFYRAVAHGADANRFPGAGHREGI